MMMTQRHQQANDQKSYCLIARKGSWYGSQQNNVPFMTSIIEDTDIVAIKVFIGENTGCIVVLDL